MADWVPVGEGPTVIRTESAGRVRLRFYSSPDDTPDAARAFFETDGGALVLEFRYPGEEPTRSRRVDDGVTIELGRHSHRIYTIRIAAERIAKLADNPVQIAECVRKEVGRIPERERRPENYEAADKILLKKARDIFSHLGPRTPPALTPA